ncbi:hypothetical protein XALC_2024 [Xanthomonas albilineans GPE PC73]|uniref:Uncharacterized protein n=2 Tax=Xanthomonas albilineans TaxID=29447 RepID=D2U8V3_XANAP|nr:hypothetical protein XALC_2024 [Xanthomonas albilineans GPE PC73]
MGDAHPNQVAPANAVICTASTSHQEFSAMTAPPFMRSLLLASLCLACGDAAAQHTGTYGSAALRIGIRILNNCEISADGNGQAGTPQMVACSHPLTYQTNIDGRPAANNDVALALSLPTTATLPSNRASYATVAF